VTFLEQHGWRGTFLFSGWKILWGHVHPPWDHADLLIRDG
jgi:hypothetical protein